VRPLPGTGAANRVDSGRAAAARGRRGGRPPVVTDDKLRRARDLIARGLTVREAAVRLKVGKTALYQALRGAQA
jgi:DNA invertase Pin-like site-specific DNA recombinase